MEKKVKELLEKHQEDKDLTGEAEQIEVGMDWSEADLRNFNLSGLKLSSLMKKANFQKAALSEANLRGSILTGANFQECRLMEANLKGAILIGSNFSFASLAGCNLTGASLVRANLREADFDEKVNLRNVNLYQTKLDGSTLKNSQHTLDHIIIQERNKKHAIARDVYMNLKNYFNKEGMYEVAGEYYYREKLMETNCICSRKNYSKWLFNHLLNITSGFGERPGRVLGWWIIVIVGFALIFFKGEGLLINTPTVSNAETFWDYLYFSIVTFSTLGFGDIAPKPEFRLLASFEAILGAILMAMFIYIFSRKMGR